MHEFAIEHVYVGGESDGRLPRKSCHQTQHRVGTQPYRRAGHRVAEKHESVKRTESAPPRHPAEESARWERPQPPARDEQCEQSEGGVGEPVRHVRDREACGDARGEEERKTLLVVHFYTR